MFVMRWIFSLNIPCIVYFSEKKDMLQQINVALDTDTFESFLQKRLQELCVIESACIRCCSRVGDVFVVMSTRFLAVA